MSANPSAAQAAAKAIVAALEGDQTLADLGVQGVYANMAPEGSAAPFIIYQLVSGPRDYTFKQLAAVYLLFQIKAIDTGFSPTVVRQIDQRIDELLMDVALTLDAPWVWKGTRRESDLPELAPLDQGTQFIQVGGNYRVTVTK